MSDLFGVSALRARVVELHDGHGLGGDAIACFECVIAALNEQEHEYLIRVKEIGDGRGV